MNCKDIQPANRQKIAIIGPSGTGKTTSIKTLSGKTLLLNWDTDGYRVLAGEDIDYEDYSSTSLATPVHSVDRFEKDIKRIEMAFNSDTPPYNNIVLDSLTKCQDVVMDYGIWQTGPVLRGKNAWSRKRIGSFEMAGKPEYGYLIDYTNWLLDTILSIPCNIIIIGHLQVFEDEKTHVVEHLPLISGRKAPHRFGIPFSEVYLSEANGMEYTWRTRPRPPASFMQTRVNHLPTVIPQDFSNLWELMSNPNLCEEIKSNAITQTQSTRLPRTPAFTQQCL